MTRFHEKRDEADGIKEGQYHIRDNGNNTKQSLHKCNNASEGRPPENNQIESAHRSLRVDAETSQVDIVNFVSRRDNVRNDVRSQDRLLSVTTLPATLFFLLTLCSSDCFLNTAFRSSNAKGFCDWNCGLDLNRWPLEER